MAVTTNFTQNVIDLVTSLSGQANTNLSNTIFTGVFEDRTIAENHMVVTGLNEGDPSIVVDTSVNYKTFPSISKTACESNECDLDIPFSSKLWSFGLYNCKIGICMKSFDRDFLFFWNQNYQVLHNPAEMDVEQFERENMDSALLDYLTKKFESNLIGTAWRVSYFADQDIDVSDPNVQLLNGGGYGFFPQFEAGSGVKRVLTNQTDPTGQDLYDEMNEAYQIMADSEWEDKDGIEFKVTRKWASKLASFLNNLNDKSQYNCDCLDVDKITGNRFFRPDNMIIFGIPVVVEKELDGVIKQLELDRPYRAVLSYRNNMQIGTQLEDDIKRMDMWYNRDDKKIYIEGEAYLGSMVVQDHYVYLGAETASV